MNWKKDPWHVAVKRGVQFSEETKCTTLDIVYSASLAEPCWSEGTVDDATLPGWLDQVFSNIIFLLYTKGCS